MKPKDYQLKFIAKCVLAWLFFAFVICMGATVFHIGKTLMEQSTAVNQQIDLPPDECDPLEDDCVNDTDDDYILSLSNSSVRDDK